MNENNSVFASEDVKAKNLNMISLLKEDPVLVSPPKIGSLAEGTIMEKTSKAVYVDLGFYGTGIIMGKELAEGYDILKKLKAGDKISAKILDLEDENGYVELSLKEASQQRFWDNLKEKQKIGEVLSVVITEANRGGLVAPVSGIKAFLPVSQLNPKHYPRIEGGDKEKIMIELGKLIGAELKVKIIDIVPEEVKLIISEKEVRSEETAEMLKYFKIGDVVDGEVTGVVDFGAFVKLPLPSRSSEGSKDGLPAQVANEDLVGKSAEGLIHISEFDYKLIDNPRDLIKIGDKVQAQIIGVDGDRISLSLKRLKEDPWKDIDALYKKGDTVVGEIIKINPFGAFIKLNDNIHGLVHISEFGSESKMREALALGQKCNFRIISIEPQDHRMALGLVPEISESAKEEK